MRAARPGAPAQACHARWQLRRDAAGPGSAGHAGCGPADRRSHDRRRRWPSREQVGPGYSAASKLEPVSLDAQRHQPGPGDSNLPGGPPWARGADVLPHLLPSHPPPPVPGDYRKLPRCRGHRHPLNGAFRRRSALPRPPNRRRVFAVEDQRLGWRLRHRRRHAPARALEGLSLRGNRMSGAGGQPATHQCRLEGWAAGE